MNDELNRILGKALAKEDLRDEEREFQFRPEDGEDRDGLRACLRSLNGRRMCS